MVLLDIFSKKKIKKNKLLKVIVDNREKNSLVASNLMSNGFEIEWKQLPVGDYIVKGIAIERKTISDLKSSIINKRIISQLFELKQYPKHLLIVEGILDEDMYSGGIHENAFRGFLLSVALEHEVPIIFTQDEEDTARYILVLARKEKQQEAIRAGKRFVTQEERQQFILEGFPGIGPKSAMKLLEKFGSLKEMFNSSEEELKEILGKKSESVKRILDYEYGEK